jgi:hypothetical protein
VTLVLDLLLLAAGEALLVGLGIVRSRGSALRFAGLAFVVGWAALGTLVSVALMLGASLALWQPVALALALVAAGVALARRLAPLRAAPALPRPAADARVVGLVAAGILAAYLLLLGVHALLAASPAIWDGWAFWIPKARALYFFHGLHPHLDGGFMSFAHPEYPPLVPAMGATVFRFAGSSSALALPFQDWLLALGFVTGTAALLARRVAAPVLWPALLVLALAPSFGRFLGAGLGDPPLGRLLALAAVAGGLWLVERDARFLGLAGILLVGAALTKNEGALLGLLLVVALVAAALCERPRRVRPVLALLPVPILAAIPWQLYLHLDHVEYSPDYRVGDVVRLSYLSARTHRLGAALEQLPGYALSFDAWLLLVPVGLLLALLVLRRRPSLGVLLLVVVGAGYLGLASVYWVSTLPLQWYIDTSAERVVGSLVLVCAALTPLLAGELLRDDAPD